MLIYVVRHGETKSNVEGRLQGQSNDPLNENGIGLAEITGRGMENVHFDACISSPLIRAKQTAEIILQQSGNTDVPIVFDKRIKEINFGIYEGKRLGTDELPKDEADNFLHAPFDFSGFPEGENIRQVCARTQEFLRELCDRDDDKTYLVTTHGCALRCMLNFLYEKPDDFWHGHVPYNCCVNVVEAKNEQIMLVEDDKVFYDLGETIDRYAKY